MSDERGDLEDFGDILAAFESGQAADHGDGKDPEAGEKVSGQVLSIGEESVFVDIGAKSDAAVARAELVDEEGALTVAVGDTVSGIVGGRDAASGCLLLRVRPGAGLGAGGREVALDELAQAHAHGIPVEGTVAEAVKGGVQVTVSGLRCFCPVSQLDLGFVEDPETYVGRRLRFLVNRFSAGGRGRRADVVLSRRALLERERRERREQALARLEVGAVVRGTVSSVAGYGVFVDLDGVDGLLHVSEIAHDRVEDPAALFAPGDPIEVEVLRIEERDEGETRISLSRRSLETDPWSEAGERFAEGTTVTGQVMRLMPYGAFVRLAPGIEGLLHVSELAGERRIAHPRELLEVGHEVEVRILDVDTEARRIALAPASGPGAEEASAAAEYAERGAGDERAGGFGAMGDFFEKARRE